MIIASHVAHEKNTPNITTIIYPRMKRALPEPSSKTLRAGGHHAGAFIAPSPGGIGGSLHWLRSTFHEIHSEIYQAGTLDEQFPKFLKFHLISPDFT